MELIVPQPCNTPLASIHSYEPWPPSEYRGLPPSLLAMKPWKSLRSMHCEEETTSQRSYTYPSSYIVSDQSGVPQRSHTYPPRSSNIVPYPALPQIPVAYGPAPYIVPNLTDRSSGPNQRRASNMYEGEYFSRLTNPVPAPEYSSPEYSSVRHLEMDSRPSSPLSVSSGVDKIIRCDECDTEFQGEYRRGNYNRHRRLYHGPQSGYPCLDSSCPKVFRRQDSRLKHHRRHHPSLGNQTPVIRRGPQGIDEGDPSPEDPVPEETHQSGMKRLLLPDSTSAELGQDRHELEIMQASWYG
jgi:hypothetical protein